MPAGGGKPSEQRVRGGRLVEMERLRIELRREGDDLRPRHRMRLERQFLTRLEVFEIAHARQLGRGGAAVEMSDQTLNLKSSTSPS